MYTQHTATTFWLHQQGGIRKTGYFLLLLQWMLVAHLKDLLLLYLYHLYPFPFPFSVLLSSHSHHLSRSSHTHVGAVQRVAGV